MKGWVVMYPSPQIFSLLDGGLTFFVGTGVVFLGLVVAEKFGIPVNESTVRAFMIVGAVVAVCFAIVKSRLFRHMLIGF
jgi:hypothetical protein